MYEKGKQFQSFGIRYSVNLQTYPAYVYFETEEERDNVFDKALETGELDVHEHWICNEIQTINPKFLQKADFGLPYRFKKDGSNA